MIGSLDALRPALPDGARWAPDVVGCPDEIRPAVHRALRDVVLVDRPAAATRLVGEQPGAARGHPGRRRGRRVRRGRRLGQGAQLHRGAGRGRRGPGQPARPPRQTIAELREQLADARAEVGRAQGGGRPSPPRPSGPPRASATPPPAGSPSWARPPGRPRPRPSGWPPPGPRPRPPASRDLAGLAELEERLRLAEDTPIDEEPSTEERDQLAALRAAGPAERDGGPARRPHRRGAGRRRSPAAPTRCCARPTPSGPPASGPPPAGPPGPAAPRSPARSRSAPARR